jgi:hypothetical protein
VNYDFCPLCQWFHWTLGTICQHCEEGDQFEEVSDINPMFDDPFEGRRIPITTA